MRHLNLNFNKNKLYMAGAACAILLVVGVGVAWSMSTNNGQITDAPKQRPSQLPAYLVYDGPEVTFQYKSVYQVQELPAKSPDMEVAMLTANTNYQKQLAVAISELPDGDLRNNSAYNMRQSDPEHYSRQTMDVDGGKATVWVKSDSMEQTVFIPHGDKVAVLAFSTVGTVDNLHAEVTALLSSFRWKD